MILRNLVLASACVLTTFLASCMSVTPKEPPAQASLMTRETIASRLPTDIEKYSGTSLPNSYFGVWGARGSLLAGLLLGPVGAIANSAYVQSTNSSRASALADLTSMNLADVLHTAVPGLSRAAAADTPGYDLIPAASLTFKDDKSFNLACIITAQAGTGSDAWRARYAVNPEAEFDRDDPLLKNKVSDALVPCFQEAYRLFRSHVSGTGGSFTVRSVDVGFDLRLPVSDAELPARVVGNDGIGLIEFRRSAVRSITP